MAQKPVPKSAAATEYVPGEVLQVDIKVFADTSEARKHVRAFGNHAGALTAVDVATGYQLEAIRIQVCASDRIQKILRIDSEFKKADIRTWAALCTPSITLQPCIPLTVILVVHAMISQPIVIRSS